MLDFLKQLFSSSGRDLRPEDLKQGTIIDVRTPAEYKRGHAESSLNIPLSEIKHSLPKIRQMSLPIITCCRSGNRSGEATEALNGSGIEAINGGTWKNVARQLPE